MERLQSMTQLHYDRLPGLYEKFLDSYMKYSSGLFLRDDDDLDTSARQMLDLHVGFAQKLTNPRILEIGPGWGSLYRSLCDKLDEFSYCAVNPSKVQNDYIWDKFAYNDISLIEAPFNEQTPLQGKFDLIYFVGSFCHMENKGEALAKVSRHLDRNGRIIIEDMFFVDSKTQQKLHNHADTLFVTHTVYGYSEIFSIAQTLETGAEYGLIPERIQDYSWDYHKTLLLWLDRLDKMSEAEYPVISEYKKCFRLTNKTWGSVISNNLLVFKKKLRGPGTSPPKGATI